MQFNWNGRQANNLDPLRKKFPAGSPFPLELVYRSRKPPEAELPNHLHDWHEVVYVHDGEGVFFIDKSFHPMQAGDLFLLPGNTVHRALPDPLRQPTVTAVFFHRSLVWTGPFAERVSPGAPFDGAGAGSPRLAVPDADWRERCEGLLARMHRELEARAPGYRHAVTLALLELLLEAARRREALTCSGAAEAGDASGARPWLRSALRRIDEQPESDLSLASLSAEVAVNAAHFSRVFKLSTGMTLTEYVSAKRIARSIDLLTSPDLSNREIAFACGFESLPHFYRTFRKVTGTTPLAYRRRGQP